jgi:hypothetical protein
MLELIVVAVLIVLNGVFASPTRSIVKSSKHARPSTYLVNAFRVVCQDLNDAAVSHLTMVTSFEHSLNFRS